MEPCVVPSALEERHLAGRMRAFLQSPEASMLDDVGRIEPPRLEVLGGWRVQPLDRGHVDRFVAAPQRTSHASGRPLRTGRRACRRGDLGPGPAREAIEVERVVPEDLALGVVTDQIGA
jgi:hypothetical protein